MSRLVCFKGYLSFQHSQLVYLDEDSFQFLSIARLASRHDPELRYTERPFRPFRVKFDIQLSCKKPRSKLTTRLDGQIWGRQVYSAQLCTRVQHGSQDPHASSKALYGWLCSCKRWGLGGPSFQALAMYERLSCRRIVLTKILYGAKMQDTKITQLSLESHQQ